MDPEVVIYTRPGWRAKIYAVDPGAIGAETVRLEIDGETIEVPMAEEAGIEGTCFVPPAAKKKPKAKPKAKAKRAK